MGAHRCLSWAQAEVPPLRSWLLGLPGGTLPPGMFAAGRRGSFLIPGKRGRAGHALAALSGQTEEGPWTLLLGVVLLVRSGVPHSFHTELLSTGDTAPSKTHLIPALKGPRSFLGADAE